MLVIYDNLLEEEPNVPELKSTIKSLSSRWIELNRKSDDLTSKYESQYRSWILYESELNAFRNQVLSDFEHRIQQAVPVDINEVLDLNRIHTFMNDLRVNYEDRILSNNFRVFFVQLLEENLRQRTTNYDRLYTQMNDVRQYCSSEGQQAVNEEQIEIDTRWKQLQRMITDKVSLNRTEIKDNRALKDDIIRKESEISSFFSFIQIEQQSFERKYNSSQCGRFEFKWVSS